ncbi:class I SAM-dependent RNA methyltransferase [Congregibacter variabilis]|uniref:Class I SAM-dependent RNA methyltransferase n=1 Tax=Congregibacter variabilis TaxID=3081200 RepID=A0ABZ0I1H2_9GAMM|nr:class I SAM-dependent RNA methyltransferase [Congregibacter sp. IMCC43200]
MPLFKKSLRASPKGTKGPKGPKKHDTGLRPGHRFEGEVRDLSSDGQGVVAHPDGRVFFVPGVWRDERGLFEVTSLKGRMGFARVISLSEESAQRRTPPCPHHGFSNDSCGGCPWLFMDYQEQLQSKQQQLLRMLQPLNTALAISPVWASPEELGYRNRAQLKSDGKRLGYVAGNSRDIAQISDCLVLNTKNRKTLADLRAQLPNPSWKPGRGKHWTTLDIDDDINASQVAVNDRRPFRQGNSAQNQRMREWLLSQLHNMSARSPVVELFAGSGNFTEVLVDAGCESVCAVDSFRQAIDGLQARLLPGVTGICSNLERDGSASDIEAQLSTAKLLLLDPPREGLKNIGDYLTLAPQLRTIIYISCNLATLSRDLQTAMQHKFQLQEVQPLDLFPQTPQIEVLTVLSR